MEAQSNAVGNKSGSEHSQMNLTVLINSKWLNASAPPGVVYFLISCSFR